MFLTQSGNIQNVYSADKKKKYFQSSCPTPRISYLLLPCDSHSSDSLSFAFFLTDCFLTASDRTEGRSGHLYSSGREVV